MTPRLYTVSHRGPVRAFTAAEPFTAAELIAYLRRLAEDSAPVNALCPDSELQAALARLDEHAVLLRDAIATTQQQAARFAATEPPRDRSPLLPMRQRWRSS